jgi:hypothetical protein
MEHSESKKIDWRKSVIVFGAKKPSFSLAQKRDFRSQLKQQSTFVPQKNGSMMICNIYRSSSHSLTKKKRLFLLLSQIRKSKKKPFFFFCDFPTPSKTAINRQFKNFPLE